MAEPTTTRQVLRRDLARQLGLEFPSRLGADFSTLTGVTSAAIVTDSKLVQANDLWVPKQAGALQYDDLASSLGIDLGGAWGLMSIDDRSRTVAATSPTRLVM